MDPVDYDGHYEGTLIDYSALGGAIGSGTEDTTEELKIELSRKTGSHSLERITVDAEFCGNGKLSSLLRKLSTQRGLAIDIVIKNGKYISINFPRN